MNQPMAGNNGFPFYRPLGCPIPFFAPQLSFFPSTPLIPPLLFNQLPKIEDDPLQKRVKLSPKLERCSPDMERVKTEMSPPKGIEATGSSSPSRPQSFLPKDQFNLSFPSFSCKREFEEDMKPTINSIHSNVKTEPYCKTEPSTLAGFVPKPQFPMYTPKREFKREFEENTKKSSESTSTAEETNDQPLDLSGWKPNNRVIVSAEEEQQVPHTEEENVDVLDVIDDNNISPQNVSVTPPMAYPRPIHPMMPDICGVTLADSPGSSNENDREDAYFDDIRSFMGKVSGSDYYNNMREFVSPSNNNIDVVKEDNNDESASEGGEDYLTSKLNFDTKCNQEKEEILNNNDQTVEVST
ncbi:unnamed protein product [Diabrotica balteata]|uniref:Uncharacterized protein n=1 Tax=Diabrotica balteata TaxID=107213 RepID=A0A9N9X8T7_DIABA|nr:unnamed protein product [Diabrotica balteata]